MKVERLSLSGFRNLCDSEFVPLEGVNVVFGDNAQGKTNLLEAIWLFSGSKSFRGAKDGDYIRFGGEVARLNLSFQAQGRSQTASIRLAPQQKQAFLNEIKLQSLSQLSGIFCAVVFSPDHLELVKKEPKHRRSLLDGSLRQAYPKYSKALDGYERILRQRAYLLRDAREQVQLLDILDAWDESLAEYGSYVAWMRLRYVNRLALYAAEAYDGIAGGREKFSARYLSGCGELPENPDGTDRAGISALLKDSLKRLRTQDIKHGITHCGPHRDDVEITVDGKSARSFGSQGQQRSCVLALKLAECRILEESCGEPPVVLLDDVTSELDDGRKGYLLNRLEGRQVFVTCCDRQSLSCRKEAGIFSMSRGRLEQE